MVANGAVSCMVALVLGLRASEISALKIRDIDAGGTLLHIDDAKTRAGVRAVTLPDLLRPYLLVLCEGRGRTGQIFEGFNRHSVLRWAKRFSVVAGVQATPHGLRGSFASLAVASGVAIEAVARTLGHADTSVTDRHYTQPGAHTTARGERVSKLVLVS